MKEWKWVLDGTFVNELCEYKNLGDLLDHSPPIFKIDKTCKKAEVIFSSDFDHQKTIHQVLETGTFINCLLVGTDHELLSLNASQLSNLDCCQWFVKKVFYVPKFTSGKLLLQLLNLYSIESEIGCRELLFWG